MAPGCSARYLGRARKLLGAVAPSVSRADARLGEWPSAHARDVSTRRLVVDVGVGGAGALLVAIWRPVGWPALLGAALCFAAFGTWAAAVVGTLAAALTVFGVLFGVLGTWIS